MLLRDWTWSQRLPASSRSVRHLEAAKLDGSKHLFPPAAYEREFFKGPLCPSSPAFVEGPMFLSLWVNTHRAGVTEPRSFFIIYVICDGKVAWICHLCTSYLFTLSFCAYFRSNFFESTEFRDKKLARAIFAACLVFFSLIFQCSRIIFSSFFTESGLQGCPHVALHPC